MAHINDASLERLELQLGRLLFAGVMSAALCLAVGLLLWAIGWHPALSHGILTTGLIILMITPLARVLTSLVVYARQHDWFFVGTTIAVFAVLLLAWLLKAKA
jgi:predicted Abi (CAAX) family protease